MGWATVLLSGVVAGVISALVSWIGGLHRDKKVAEQQAMAAVVDATYRREDVRRDRLTDAIVDFLAADRQRFEGTRSAADVLRQLAEWERVEDHDRITLRAKATEALAEFDPHRDSALSAMQRIGLYAPDLYDLAERTYQLIDLDSTAGPRDRAAREQVYRAAVDALVAAARVELGIASPLLPV